MIDDLKIFWVFIGLKITQLKKFIISSLKKIIRFTKRKILPRIKKMWRFINRKLVPNRAEYWVQIIVFLSIFVVGFFSPIFIAMSDSNVGGIYKALIMDSDSKAANWFERITFFSYCLWATIQTVLIYLTLIIIICFFKIKKILCGWIKANWKEAIRIVKNRK